MTWMFVSSWPRRSALGKNEGYSTISYSEFNVNRRLDWDKNNISSDTLNELPEYSEEIPKILSY